MYTNLSSSFSNLVTNVRFEADFFAPVLDIKKLALPIHMIVLRTVFVQSCDLYYHTKTV